MALLSYIIIRYLIIGVRCFIKKYYIPNNPPFSVVFMLEASYGLISSLVMMTDMLQSMEFATGTCWKSLCLTTVDALNGVTTATGPTGSGRNNRVVEDSVW